MSVTCCSVDGVWAMENNWGLHLCCCEIAHTGLGGLRSLGAQVFGPMADELAAKDRRLLHRSLDLDRREALNGFLAGIERRAFRIALMATGNRDDAHEIVQEAMLSLVQRYAARPEEEWPLLFHRILQNGVRDWHRRAKVRSRLVRWFGWGDDESAGDPIDRFPDHREPGPDRQYASDELMQRLEQSIGALPLRQQQAFLLRAWEGLDVKDTAQAMGCSEGSVKTHFSRAVRALRSQLGELI